VLGRGLKKEAGSAAYVKQLSRIHEPLDDGQFRLRLLSKSISLPQVIDIAIFPGATLEKTRGVELPQASRARQASPIDAATGGTGNKPGRQNA